MSDSLTFSLDDLIPLDEARHVIPGEPHLVTIRRWVASGVRGTRLKTVKVGNRVYTTRAAIPQFVKDSNRDES